MSLSLVTGLRESARNHPDKNAIVIGSTRISYARLHDLVTRCAGALRALGVKPGQHVALMLPNVPQFTIAYYGALYASATVVPLNVLLTADEIAYHLDDSEAVALIVWEGFLDSASEGFGRVNSCKHLIIAKADPGDMSTKQEAHNFAALIAGAVPVTEMPATNADDTAVILYTSGTTGRAKGAELTQFNMFFNWQVLTQRLLALDESTVALATLPLFHSFGQTVIQNGVLAAGGTLVMLPRFDATEAMSLIVEHRINFFAGVPTMYFAMLNHPEAAKFDLSVLHYCVSGGSAMPVEVMRAFDEKYGVNILEGYGLSETSPIASFNRLDRAKKPGSIGLPVWGCEFLLLDEEGQVVREADTAGEICIKGHNVMKGYYKRPEANAESIVDGWFRTGDVATRDAEGYYFIVDRKKDMIIRGGFNVYPREIEELLYAHPAIAEAAVIGVAHESLGEEVKAVVALKPGQAVGDSELIAYCKQHLAAYKYPRSIEFRESLPKNATGKILKRELR